MATKIERDQLRNDIKNLGMKHSGIFNEMEYFDKDGEKDYILYHFELNGNSNFIRVSFDNLDTGLYQKTLEYVACLYVRIDFECDLDDNLSIMSEMINDAHCEIVYKAGGRLS